jgi:hypothetical protein
MKLSRSFYYKYAFVKPHDWVNLGLILTGISSSYKADNGKVNGYFNYLGGKRFFI